MKKLALIAILLGSCSAFAQALTVSGRNSPPAEAQTPLEACNGAAERIKSDMVKLGSPARVIYFCPYGRVNGAFSEYVVVAGHSGYPPLMTRAYQYLSTVDGWRATDPVSNPKDIQAQIDAGKCIARNP